MSNIWPLIGLKSEFERVHYDVQGMSNVSNLIFQNVNNKIFKIEK